MFNIIVQEIQFIQCRLNRFAQSFAKPVCRIISGRFCSSNVFQLNYLNFSKVFFVLIEIVYQTNSIVETCENELFSPRYRCLLFIINFDKNHTCIKLTAEQWNVSKAR